MSGGSLDYAYEKVQETAHSILKQSENVEQRAFGYYLFKVSMALKDLEWYFSGDISNPKPESMLQLIGKNDVGYLLKTDAEKLIKQLQDYIGRIDGEIEG